jgi:ferric-dicitrate binding protein FerR (iron transport regulator)
MTESILELISAYLYGHITAEQYEELRAWLAADPRHVREYIQEAYLHHATRLVLQRREVERTHVEAEGQSKSDSSNGPAELFRKAIESDIEFLKETRGRLSPEEIQKLADRKLAAFLEEQHRQELQEQRQAGLEPRMARIRRSLSSVAGAMATIGIKTSKLAAVVTLVILFLALYVFHVQESSEVEVATLADALDARWDVSIETHTSLHRGQFKLNQGYARILFQTGADVSIEAPAEFRLESDKRMTLLSGRVFADVPPSARGFTVDTPQASIVDLGTQFGVKVESGNGSDLHMFKGKASLTPAAAAGNSKSEIITAGQAGSVDPAGRIRSIQVKDTAFVRRFFPGSGSVWRGQAIDLADIVGGGNGLGAGQLNRWLEINTGLDGTRFIVNGQATQSYQTTDNRYHRVTHLPYVDGVFSPDANAGPVEVSSQRHVWPDCPKTSGRFFEDIFNGDHISFGIDTHGFVLKGQAYGTRELSAIALHSNAGITFDLGAMRGDMPGLEIVEFKARCGISEDVKKRVDSTQRGTADFWVLVDGKKRFEAKGMNVDSEPQEISVPLSRQECFVTLVTTDGDGRANFDWGFFAEPRLEVQAVQ